MAEHSCLLCPVYRPDAEPRHPNRMPVCDADRRLVAAHLADVGDLHHRLTHPDALPVADHLYEVYDRCGELLGVRHAEPLAPMGGAGPVPGESRRPRVSGSTPEPPAPTPLGALDLTLPAREASRALYARGQLGLDPDQVGTLSAATILDTWVRDWRGTLWPDHTLPVPTVAALVGWLRLRVEDACDQHPAVDDFAAEIRELRGSLRGALGDVDAQPETDQFEGVACRRCDLRGVLLRRPGDIYIECGNCGLLYSDDEYEAWRNQLAGYERSIRTADEIDDLLRRPLVRVDA